MSDAEPMASPCELASRVDAWCGGALPADSMRVGIARALARRAVQLEGEARERVMRRLEQLLANEPAPATGVSMATAHVPTAGLSALSALVDRLGRAPAPVSAPAAPSAATLAAHPPMPQAAAPAVVPLSREASPSPLKAVSAFQGTWSRLRVEQRLRQALAQVPASAGPLNTSHIVNRALQAMQDLSPAYLDAFMSHVDTLQALEPMWAGDLPDAPVRAAAPARSAVPATSRNAAPAPARKRAAARSPRKA